MKKRWMFVLIAAAMLLVVFPAGSLAAGARPQGGALLEESATAGETATETTEPTSVSTPTEEPTATYPPIDLSPSSVTLTMNTDNAYCILKSSNYSVYSELEFSSSDPSVVWCSEYYISAQYPGKATITATVIGTNISEKCAVTVLPPPVEGLIMYCYSTASVNQGFNISVYTTPSGYDWYYENSYKWFSSDTTVVSIEEIMPNYISVRCLREGIATVTVKTVYGGYSVAQTITVVDNSPTSSPTLSATPKPSHSSASAVITPTPAPTKFMDTSALPSPTREPVVLEAAGWAAAEEAVQTMDTGSLGSIEAPEDDMLVPASLLDTLLQTQTALEIDCGGYFCVIDGAALTDVPDSLEAVDIGMTMEKDAAFSAAWGGSAYELRFNYHGELPGTFTFRVKAEGSRPGDTVYLYYLNEGTDEFEGVHTAVVDDEGYVSLNITHCSSYYLTDAIIEGAANNFVLPAETEAAEEAQPSGFAAFVHNNKVAFWLCVYFLGVGIVAAVIVIVYRSIRRSGKPDTRREDPVKHTTYIR